MPETLSSPGATGTAVDPEAFNLSDDADGVLDSASDSTMTNVQISGHPKSVGRRHLLMAIGLSWSFAVPLLIFTVANVPGILSHLGHLNTDQALTLVAFATSLLIAGFASLGFAALRHV